MYEKYFYLWCKEFWIEGWVKETCLEKIGQVC